MLIDNLPPGLILIVGALVLPFLSGQMRHGVMLALPVISLAHIWLMDPASPLIWQAFGAELVPIRIDKLAMIFGTIFHIAAFVSLIFAMHEEKATQHVAGLSYAGAAIGAVFAGDLITLFVYWELTAITSVFLILARNTAAANRAAIRYLVIQIGSGVILLSGLILHFAETGSIAFDHLGLNSPGTFLIFLAFGIKCAFPLLHNWLQDAYPEATVGGTVWLSGFTTKLAVYALARSFAGEEILIWIGVTMTAFPIFYAVIENDLRRVLAYSLNNQLGYMVVGIGLGTEMAINGTAAHAFCHILYKALLFMSMGAVLYRVGTVKGSELGGLYKSMPWTTGFCIIGAASISAFPLFSGFVSKSLILTAAADEGYFVVWLILLFASAGVFHHSGIKIPYFAFFAHDSGKRCQEAPMNMLVAMGITAFLCIAIGVWPAALYGLLPYAVDYAPYTVSHVITQLQLLMFSALAFAVLMRTGLYPPELKSTNLDFDWLYRALLPKAVRGLFQVGAPGWTGLLTNLQRLLAMTQRQLASVHAPHGVFAHTWRSGSMVLCAAALLGLALLFSFIR